MIGDVSDFKLNPKHRISIAHMTFANFKIKDWNEFLNRLRQENEVFTKIEIVKH